MNELRQDITSGDWVLLAPGRAARPHFLEEKKKPRTPTPLRQCPFEDLEASGNWPPIYIAPEIDQWQYAIIPNKYPAVMHSNTCSVPFRKGIYHARSAVGRHSLLITRDHNTHFADLTRAQVETLFGILQDYHAEMARDRCAAYVSSFYNFGPSAGASLWHPHYQILTLPIIPPHTAHSLHGAREYFKKNKRCVRCDIVKVERRQGVRVIEESEHGVALVPYAAKKPLEVSILPKKHWDSFRDAPREVVHDIALLLQSVLRRMRRYANDPDLNFFLHDTPLDKKDYRFHHWHIEVVPKISIDAGFELSTGIEVNVVDPDVAAKILRGGHAK